MKNILIIIMFSVILIGCSSTKEVQKDVIRESIVPVTLPVEPIEAVIPVVPVNLPDTSYKDFVDSFSDSSKLEIKAETKTGNIDVVIKKKYDDKGLPYLSADAKAQSDSAKGDYLKKDSSTTNTITEKPNNTLMWIAIILFLLAALAIIFRKSIF
jgi:hypothetical protein